MYDKKTILTTDEQNFLIKEIRTIYLIEQVFTIIILIWMLISEFKWKKIDKLLGWSD